MIPVSAPSFDTALLAVAAWLITYLIHSTILLGAVWLLGRYLRPALALEDTMWRVALVGAMATALWQVAGFGATPFGHRIGLDRDVRVMEALPATLVSWSPAEAPAFADAGRETDAPLSAPETFVEGEGSPLTEGLFFDTAPAADVEDRDVALRFRPWHETSPAETSTGETAPIEASTGEMTAYETATGETGAAFTAIPATSSWTSDADAARAPVRGLEPAGAVRTPRALFMGATDRVHSWMTGIPWLELLLAAWVFGAGVGMGRLALARFRLHRMLRGRSELTSGHLIGMLDRLRAAAGVRRPVRLSMSTRVAGPVALGSGEICLPRRVLTDLTPGQQQTVLAHELAHLERGDPGWLWIAAAMEAVFFFQPLNRIARRRLRDAAEFLCDDWAVRHAGGNLILARCLAEVAGWVQASPALASGMAQKSSPLVRRIERLLEDRDLFREPGRGWRLLAGLVMVGVVAAAAPGITTGSYERPDNAPWTAGLAPWPDYPFVLTPPGWTTTPLSTTTWSPAPLTETEGDLGALYGSPGAGSESWFATPDGSGAWAGNPPTSLNGYPSPSEGARFTRSWPSPRMVLQPFVDSDRTLPPSPREAIRLRPRAEQARGRQQEKTQDERARHTSLHESTQLQVARIREARARREEALQEARRRETDAERTRARTSARRDGTVWVGEPEPSARRDDMVWVIEPEPVVETEPAPVADLSSPPSLPQSFSILSGEIEIPAERLAAAVGQLNEHLDGSFGIQLGEIAAGLELSAEDGVVDLQVNLDRIKETVATLQKQLPDREEQERLRRVLREAGRNLKSWRITEEARREVERGLTEAGLGDTMIFFGVQADSTEDR